MAASRSDMNLLSLDPGFIARVRMSMISTAIAVANESIATAQHRQRDLQATLILNAPEQWKFLIANGAATDASVISDATANGTVVLTAGNAATQAPLVTDTHIDNAISGQFNAFFVTPSPP